MTKTSKKPEISQLHRLEGQIHGIERMLNQNGTLISILQQIEAVRGSLKSLEKRLISQYNQPLDKKLKQCLGYLMKLN